MNDLENKSSSSVNEEKKYIFHAEAEPSLRDLINDILIDSSYKLIQEDDGSTSLETLLNLKNKETKENPDTVMTLRDFFQNRIQAIISDGGMTKMHGPVYILIMRAIEQGLLDEEGLKNILNTLDKNPEDISIKNLGDLLSKTLQGHSPEKAVPIILNTGGLSDDLLESEKKAIESLITKTLSKPFSFQELQEAVSTK